MRSVKHSYIQGLLLYLLPNDCFGGGRFVLLNPELGRFEGLENNDQDILKVKIKSVNRING